MYDASRATPDTSHRPRIAIVGTGISGLSAAWHLHPHADITVFEKEDRPGGHSHSVNIGSAVTPLWVDMGFIVFNTPCYPNLTALLDYIGVPHQSSDMSFGVSIDKGQLEYASVSLAGLLAQWGNVVRPRFLRLMWDLVRFYKTAPLDHKARQDERLTLGQYLISRRYSRPFIEDHLVPQAAAIWSTSAAEVMDYPFRAFMTFFENHGLLKLNLAQRIQWRTVTGGSQAYVARLVAPFKHRIRTQCGIAKAERHAEGVTLTDTHGALHHFDEVVFATHAHDTLRILGDNATPQEAKVLSAFRYTDNEVVMHSDASLMPRRRHAWASWNYIGRKNEMTAGRMLCVTYWMNLLQNLPGQDVFVTLNPVTPIAEDKVIKRMMFDHPLFDQAAIAAQTQLGALQGVNRTWFCGAYFGAGFHEDGLQSGLAVAEAISGVSRPWAFDWSRSRIFWQPARATLEAAE